MSNIEELTTAVVKPKRRASRSRSRRGRRQVVRTKRAGRGSNWVASLGLILSILVCFPLMLTEFVVPAVAFFALVLICFIQSSRT